MFIAPVLGFRLVQLDTGEGWSCYISAEVSPGLGFTVLKKYSCRDCSYLLINWSKLGVSLAGRKELTKRICISPLQRIQSLYRNSMLSYEVRRFEFMLIPMFGQVQLQISASLGMKDQSACKLRTVILLAVESCLMTEFYNAWIRTQMFLFFPA